MNPLRLYLVDFMNHRLTDLDLSSFSTVLIVAKDKNNESESNGIGKTTIYHAIHYALFGEYCSDTIDEIIRFGANKCIVTFEFEVADGIYRITRTRSKKTKKSDLAIWKKKGDDWQAISQKTSQEVDKELKKIIRISFDAWKNSILFAQSDLSGLSGLAGATTEGRKVILKEALSLLDYGKMEKIAKEKLKEASELVARMKDQINFLGKPEDDLKDLQTKLQSNAILLQTNIDQRDKQKTISSDLLAQLHKLELQTSTEDKTLSQELAVIFDQKLKLTYDQSVISTKLDNKIKEIIKHKNDIAEKEKYISNISAILVELSNQMLRDQSVIKAELTKMDQFEITGRTSIAQTKEKITALKLPMPEGQSCPHCRQVLTAEHKKTCQDQIKTDLFKYQGLLSTSEEKLQIIKSKKIVLNQELTNLEIHKKKIEENNNIYSIKSSELIFLKNGLKQLEDIKAQLQIELDTHKTNLQFLQSKEKELESQIAKQEARDLNKELSNIKTQLSKVQTEEGELSLTIDGQNTSKGMLSEKIANKQQDLIILKQYQEQLLSLEKTHFLKQKVSQSFSSNGIPGMIILSILNDLQFESNNFLHQICPSIQLQIDANLEILYTIHGTVRSYKLLSGGQKLAVSLSLKLGLALVIQKRLGISIKFLELDEVDQPLDPVKKQALVDIIKKLQEKFKIFVITHDNWFKNKFSTAILIENDGKNGACGKVVTSW